MHSISFHASAAAGMYPYCWACSLHVLQHNPSISDTVTPPLLSLESLYDELSWLQLRDGHMSRIDVRSDRKVITLMQ